MEQISDCEDIIETLNSRASCSNRLQVIPLNELISFEKMKFSKGRVCLKTRKFEWKNKKQTIFGLEIPICPAMLTMHRQRCLTLSSLEKEPSRLEVQAHQRDTKIWIKAKEPTDSRTKKEKSKTYESFCILNVISFGGWRSPFSLYR